MNNIVIHTGNGAGELAVFECKTSSKGEDHSSTCGQQARTGKIFAEAERLKINNLRGNGVLIGRCMLVLCRVISSSAARAPNHDMSWHVTSSFYDLS